MFILSVFSSSGEGYELPLMDITAVFLLEGGGEGVTSVAVTARFVGTSPSRLIMGRMAVGGGEF